jgi:hypothetical protein
MFENYNNIQLIGGGKPSSEYTPLVKDYNSNLLNLLASTNPQIPNAINCWQSTVGSLDSSIHTNKSERFKEYIYNIFYTDLDWSEKQDQIVSMVATEGNAIIEFDKKTKQINIESIYNYRIYYNEKFKIYSYKKVNSNGQEQPERLLHGVDIFHLKDPAFIHLAICPSRIETIINYLSIDNSATKLQKKFYDDGMIGITILDIDPAVRPDLMASKVDENGLTAWQRLSNQIKNWFGGFGKSNTIGLIAGLRNKISLNTSNSEAQTKEILKELTPERVAWGFSLTMVNFGESATYNNGQAFDTLLYGKIGRSLERQLDNTRNWIIKLLNITDCKIYYNSQNNQNQIDNQKVLIEEVKNGLLTINEYREIRGYKNLTTIDATNSTDEQEKKNSNLVN